MKLCLLLFFILMIIGSRARPRESTKMSRNEMGNENQLNAVLMKFIKRKLPNIKNEHQLSDLLALLLLIQRMILDEIEKIYWEKESKKASNKNSKVWPQMLEMFISEI